MFDEKDEDFVDVCVETLGVTIPISREDVFEMNPETSNFSDLQDLTSLRHLHEPAILHILEGRSYADCPYTYLSGILVSVNPLIKLEESLEAGFKAAPGAFVPPHPYALAETAFQQLCFATKNQDRSCVSAQSIVIAGESGAGKTEVGKRVLQHLIKRSSASSSSNESALALEQQLLGVNPILESFGNAATLRNHNSSRFGKFTKLHFDCNTTGNASSDVGSGVALVHASICSYLLERSRIVFHSPGERSFRVFYELINGADEELRAKANLGDIQQGLKGYNFNFIKAEDQGDFDSKDQLADDKEAFEQLVQALVTVGLGDSLDSIFLMVACILHLGNLNIAEEESEQGRVAYIDSKSKDAEATTSKLLGLLPGTLEELICERTVNLPGSEVVNVRRKLSEAIEARNALAKSLYSALFDWLIERINNMLAPDATAAKQFEHSYVGVLDIFGFETFAINDFEQLLINFANEALQETFREKVLVAEAMLYRQEGLVLDCGSSSAHQNEMSNAAGCDNVELSCIALLKGTKKMQGILYKLAAESECPNPKDEKFVATLHSTFTSHPLFVPPHPKDRQSTFIISHYASCVTYTVGNFTQKNLDRLPKDAQAVLGQSESNFVIDMLVASTAASTAPRSGTLKRQQTIASNFSRQIESLVDDLNATQCSFVRCIKPNLSLSRDHQDGKWFDDRYVLDQLRCLGIAQTAQALRGGGFPTRIDYKDVMENFREQIPGDHFQACTKLLDVGSAAGLDEIARQRRRNARFIRALFWAFDIPQDTYRCGLTKVFFKPGALQKVDAMLKNSGTQSGTNQEHLARFKRHCARSAWRSCCTKVIAANRFLAVLQTAREVADRRRKQQEKLAAIQIQSIWRMALAMDRFRVVFQAVLVAQSFWRMCSTRQAFKVKLEIARNKQKQAEAEAIANAKEEERLREEENEAERIREQALRAQQQMQLQMMKDALIAHNESLDRVNSSAGMSTIQEEEEESSWKSRHISGTFVPPSVSESVSSSAKDSNEESASARAEPPPLPPKPVHKRGLSLQASELENPVLSKDNVSKAENLSHEITDGESKESTQSESTTHERPRSGRDIAQKYADVNKPPPPPPPKSDRTLKRQSVRARGQSASSIVSDEGLAEDMKRRSASMGDKVEISSNLRKSTESGSSSSGKSKNSSSSSSRKNKGNVASEKAKVSMGTGGARMSERKQRLYARRGQSGRNTEEQEQKKQRTIFLRLRQEEKSYVDALSIINGNYYQPTLQSVLNDDISSTKGISRQDTEGIFSNLPQLLQIHMQMLTSIEEELAKHKQDMTYPLTTRFLAQFQDSLPYLRTVYLVYVKQNSTSLRILGQARSEVPRFAKFLRITAENKTLPSYGTDLRDLLKIPLNQMARYNEFLNMLLSCMHPDNRDYKELREVGRKIEGIKRELENERRLSRLRIRAYEIASELEGVGKSAWVRKGKTQLLSNVNKARSHHSLLDLSAAAAAVPGQHQSLSLHHADSSSDGSDLNSAPQSHILVPGRQFLCEWVAPLSVSERKLDEGRHQDVKPKARAFFLFSDVLVISKKVANRKYDLRMWIDLSKIWVDASHITSGSQKTTQVREQFEEALNDRNERVYPLQIVYISMAGGMANTGHTSLAIRLLQNASGGPKKRKVVRHENLAPRVENLILWFRSPVQRREAFQNLTSASKALKKRREQLAKMQAEFVGKGAAGAAVMKAAQERLAHLCETPIQLEGLQDCPTPSSAVA